MSVRVCTRPGSGPARPRQSAGHDFIHKERYAVCIAQPRRRAGHDFIHKAGYAVPAFSSRRAQTAKPREVRYGERRRYLGTLRRKARI